MLAYGSTYEGGLRDFYTNTAQDFSLLTGLVSGLVVSTIVSVTVSLCMKKPDVKVMDSEEQNVEESSIANHSGPYSLKPDNDLKVLCGDIEVEWLKTMSIDNPLKPYREIYKKELAAINAGRILTVHHMETIFKKTRFISIVSVAISFIVFLFVIPIISLTQEVLSETQLSTWISVCQHWCLGATVFVVIIPPLQEGYQIWRQNKMNKALIDDKADEFNLKVNSDVKF